MKPIRILAALCCLLSGARSAAAFCGFYVAQADGRLTNQASRVVLVRDGERTVVTMSSDYHGALKQFALVVPVPVKITREQVHVGEARYVDHLDSFSAPRLVEYFDEDPCALRAREEKVYASAPSAGSMKASNQADALGVRIEARYTVGEYDILILSAQQSGGLATWLRREGYRLPPGAEEVLGSYVRQNMKFFVAKVNLAEQSRLGFSTLRPIQIAYESPKFMLPIRLGMVNADGPQDLVVLAITRSGRVECTNYRNVRIPTGMDLPLYVRADFPAFYKALFARQAAREASEAVFTEYAWPMTWCDPCAAPPLTAEELRGLGVFWADESGASGAGTPTFLTRIHVRYDHGHFPEDLVFQETADSQPFQARYVLRHPWRGTQSCSEASHYLESLRKRKSEEARRLEELTGWSAAEIRRNMAVGEDAVGASARPEDLKWYERIWKN